MVERESPKRSEDEGGGRWACDEVVGGGGLNNKPK